MKEIIYKCDSCGKRVRELFKFEIYPPNNDNIFTEYYEICVNCKKQICKELNKYKESQNYQVGISDPLKTGEFNYENNN